MAVRIPGQQPTFGLEPLFLPGSADWMARPLETAGGVLAPSTAASSAIADRDVVPSANTLAGDQTIPTDSGFLSDAIDGQANTAAILADRVNSRRGDPLAPSFPGITDAVNQTGRGIGPPPVGVHPQGPQPPIPEPDQPQPPDQQYGS